MPLSVKGYYTTYLEDNLPFFNRIDALIEIIKAMFYEQLQVLSIGYNITYVSGQVEDPSILTLLLTRVASSLPSSEYPDNTKYTA